MPTPSSTQNRPRQAMWYLRPTTGMSSSWLNEGTRTSSVLTSTSSKPALVSRMTRHFHSPPGDWSAIVLNRYRISIRSLLFSNGACNVTLLHLSFAKLPVVLITPSLIRSHRGIQCSSVNGNAFQSRLIDLSTTGLSTGSFVFEDDRRTEYRIKRVRRKDNCTLSLILTAWVNALTTSSSIMRQYLGSRTRSRSTFKTMLKRINHYCW
jgi:hypothetical protein